MNNRYDVEQIRSLMRTMDAEREMNYIGYLSNEIDDKTLLLDLRIHVEQLRQLVTELEARKMKPFRLWCILLSACFVGSLLGVSVALLFR